MRIHNIVQFNFHWPQVVDFLNATLTSKIRKSQISDGLYYSSVCFEDSQSLVVEFQKANKLIEGQSLIRLIRTKNIYEISDISQDDYYVLTPRPNRESIRLVGEPSNYYDISIDCEHCARWIWTQKKDYCIKNKRTSVIDVLENEVPIVSVELKKIIESQDLKGIHFRRILGSDLMLQIETNQLARVKFPNEYILGKDICSKCNRFRVLAPDNSNKISLFENPQVEPRIENPPILVLSEVTGDFTRTDLEFGTVGRCPENASVCDPRDYTHQTSSPLWVISGRFCRILFETKAEFEIGQVKIEE